VTYQKTGAIVGLLLALAGCAEPPAPLPYISPEALAAIPEGTDLSTVWRRQDGCYFIQTEDELTGYLIMVKDGSDTQVCDPI